MTHGDKASLLEGTQASRPLCVLSPVPPQHDVHRNPSLANSSYTVLFVIFVPFFHNPLFWNPLLLPAPTSALCLDTSYGRLALPSAQSDSNSASFLFELRPMGWNALVWLSSASPYHHFTWHVTVLFVGSVSICPIDAGCNGEDSVHAGTCLIPALSTAVGTGWF